MTEREPGWYWGRYWTGDEWAAFRWDGSTWHFGRDSLAEDPPAIIGPRITPPEGGKDG